MSAGAATLPLGPLTDYLRAQGLVGAEPIEVAPLSGGQSNPIFRITAGENAYVLRKKPAGLLAPSAHAIDREYRVMRIFTDMRAFRIYDGPSEVHRWSMARKLVYQAEKAEAGGAA